MHIKRGQSTLEYAVLIALILSSILIMQFYVKRGYQGRLKQEADSVGGQYSPGHTTSSITTIINSSSTSESSRGQTDVSSSTSTSVSKHETVAELN